MEYDILQRCGEFKIGLQAIRNPLCESLGPEQRKGVSYLVEAWHLLRSQRILVNQELLMRIKNLLEPVVINTA